MLYSSDFETDEKTRNIFETSYYPVSSIFESFGILFSSFFHHAVTLSSAKYQQKLLPQGLYSKHRMHKSIDQDKRHPLDMISNMNTISEEGTLVPLAPVKKTRSARRREARSKAAAKKVVVSTPAACAGGSNLSEALASFIREHGLPEDLLPELDGLGVYEPEHLLDLDADDKGSLGLKKLELKRLVKAIDGLAGPTQEAPEVSVAQPAAASVGPSAPATELAPVKAPEVTVVAQQAAASVGTSFAAKAFAAKALLPPVSKPKAKSARAVEEECLVVNDPRVNKMTESECLYLLREVPGCRFKAQSSKPKAGGRTKLTLRKIRKVSDAKVKDSKGRPTLVNKEFILSDICFGAGPRYLHGDTQFGGDEVADAINRCITIGHRFVVCAGCNEPHHEGKMAAHRALHCIGVRGAVRRKNKQQQLEKAKATATKK